jgi:8-oxo-dGTP pyrophosphatase MutT (NUDIX family)
VRQELRALLTAHRPSDDREAGFVEAMLALLELPGDPLSRGHFTPGHFTASAFVLSPDGGALLLVHHGKLHRWLQPGGHLEPDDAGVFAAARREVLEEVGIGDVELAQGEALFDVDVHDIPSLKGDPVHRHYDLRVLLRSRTLAARAGSDAKDVRWVALEDVNLAESDESVMRAVRKLART